jgi:hypothetical protein
MFNILNNSGNNIISWFKELSVKDKILYSIDVLLALLLVLVLIDMMFLGQSMQLNESPFSIGIGSGDSMDPVIDAGCSITVSENYDADDKLEEGDIIIYNYDNKNIIHQVIKKYNSYNPDKAKYKITKSYYTEESRFAIKNGADTDYYSTMQPISRSEKLRGETVYIVKGAGNNYIDPVLLTDQDIKNKVYTQYIEISDSESVCRSNILENLDKINIKFHY